MNSTIVELRVTPPLEHPHIDGVLARLTIPSEPDSAKASIRARRYQAMDWMEHDPSAEWDTAELHSIDAAHPLALLRKLIAARLPLIASTLHGIHETSYQLKIYAGASSCEFNWRSDPPVEWKILGEIVREIQIMAEGVLSAAQRVRIDRAPPRSDPFVGRARPGTRLVAPANISSVTWQIGSSG